MAAVQVGERILHGRLDIGRHERHDDEEAPHSVDDGGDRGQQVDQVAEQQAARARAEGSARQSDGLVEASELAERRHHWLTAAAALLEIGIGVSSVSIITKNRTFWLGALALGIGGLVLFALAWLAT